MLLNIQYQAPALLHNPVTIELIPFSIGPSIHHYVSNMFAAEIAKLNYTSVNRFIVH